MLFNSLPFFLFAATFFPAYFLLKGSSRLLLILAASYFFYGWWDWRFLGLIGFSTLFDFIIGLRLGMDQSENRRRCLLFASIVANLGLLFLFKYLNFFADSLQVVANSFGMTLSWTTLNIILPVGISFYTFQTLSYTIDIYRRECEPETNFIRFASYVALFPQLVAGPIVRASKLLPQLREDLEFNWTDTVRGFELVCWGFFLKVVVADTLALQVDPSFGSPEAYGVWGHLVGVFFFSFQIYADFAGYSLIAIGLGRIMGLDFGENFRRPYFSISFSEFWRRWHISLSSWLRDYLYISLGGNRGGATKTARNLLLTMFLGGLWHGAAWTFVIWGLLHGLYLVIWHACANFVGTTGLARFLADTRASKLCLMLVVFILTALAWIFFRADSLSNAMIILEKIASFDRSVSLVTQDPFILVKGFALIATVIGVDAIAEQSNLREAYLSNQWLRALSLACIIWSVALFGTFSGSSFIYFQF